MSQNVGCNFSLSHVTRQVARMSICDRCVMHHTLSRINWMVQYSITRILCQWTYLVLSSLLVHRYVNCWNNRCNNHCQHHIANFFQIEKDCLFSFYPYSIHRTFMLGVPSYCIYLVISRGNHRVSPAWPLPLAVNYCKEVSVTKGYSVVTE